MTEFTFSTVVARDPEEVFVVLRDIERYPVFMGDVKSVHVESLGANNARVSRWHIDVDGTSIKWTQEDTIDDNDRTIMFRSIKGDYLYEGDWRVAPISGGARLTVRARFDWGVPNFEKYFGDVYAKKARHAVKSMLIALRRRLVHG